MSKEYRTDQPKFNANANKLYKQTANVANVENRKPATKNDK